MQMEVGEQRLQSAPCKCAQRTVPRSTGEEPLNSYSFLEAACGRSMSKLGDAASPAVHAGEQLWLLLHWGAGLEAARDSAQ